MKRMIINKLMVALVIILLYFNNGIQGTKAINDDKNRITDSLLSDKNEVLVKLPAVNMNNNININTDEVVEMASVNLSEIENTSTYYSATSNIQNAYEIHRYTEEENDNTQLRKKEYVLVQLENTFDDFIKTLLTFINPTEKMVQGLKNLNDEDEYAHVEYWTNDLIRSEVESFILKKLKEHDEMKDTTWEPKNVEKIIQLIPDVFGANVMVFDKHRKNNGYNRNTPDQYLNTIFIINDGDKWYPVRRINDLQKEFQNLDLQNKINFSPLSQHGQDSDNVILNSDYEDLKTAIYTYNPNKDYKEKNQDKRKKLETIKINLDTNDGTWKKQLDDIKRYTTASRRESKLNGGIDLEIMQIRDVKNPEKYFTIKGEIIASKQIYALAECVEIYVDDWKNINDTKFLTLKENCCIYRDDNPAYAEKLEDEDLINFLYWYEKDIKLNHQQILAKVNFNKKWGVTIPMIFTLFFVVIPCCSAWKHKFMQEHQPMVPIYDMPLGNNALALFSMWSIYTLAYFQYNIPLFNDTMHTVQDIKLKVPALSFEEKNTVFAQAITSIKKSWNDCTSNKHVDNIIFCKYSRTNAMKAFEWVETYLEGHGKNTWTLLLTLFVFNAFGNSCLNALREVFGLHDIIPPPMPFYKVIHKPLVSAKVWVLVFGGETAGFGEDYYMHNILDSSLGQLLDTGLLFLFVKMTALVGMIPSVVEAKLIKVTIIALCHKFASYRIFRPIVWGFKKLFHIRYDNEKGYFEFILANWLPILCKLLVVGGIIGLKNFIKHDHALEFVKEDLGDFVGIFGLVFAWDFVKPLRNILHKEIRVMSENVDNNNNQMTKTERFTNLLSLNNTNIIWSTFFIVMLSFYSLFPGVEHSFGYIFEFFMNLIGLWTFAIAIDRVAVLTRHVYCKLIDNANYSHIRIIE